MTSTSTISLSKSAATGFSPIIQKLSSSKTEFFANTLNKMSEIDIQAHEEKIIADIKSMIIGYNSKIITPIGKLCALYAGRVKKNR